MKKNGRVLKSVTSVSRGTFEEKWFFWNQYSSIRFSEFEPKSQRTLVEFFWKGSQNCIQHVQKYFLISTHLFGIFSLNHFRFLGDKLSAAGLWKPQFRCPEEDIEEIFFVKKNRFSRFFPEERLELSYFRQKNPTVLPKKACTCPERQFEEQCLFWNFLIFWTFSDFARKIPSCLVKNLRHCCQNHLTPD